jgi:hypothetical protein
MDVPWGWGNCEAYPCTEVERALAAERRATVERMQRETQRFYRHRTGGGAPDTLLGAMEDAVRATLDEEAE